MSGQVTGLRSRAVFPALVIPVAVIGVFAGVWGLNGAAQDMRASVNRMIDDRDGAVCARLGLGPENDKNAICKEELLRLRQQDRGLLAAGYPG